VKDPEAHRLAEAIANATGETLTRAVMEALRERYERIQNRREKASVEELLAIAERLGPSETPVSGSRRIPLWRTRSSQVILDTSALAAILFG